MPDLFNIAELGATFLVGGIVVGVLQRIALTNRLAGVQRPVAAPKPVQARRANRMEAPVIDEDTTELPGLTGRQRWVNGVDAAVAMRAGQQIWHGETSRVRVAADEILTGAGIREIFADVLAEATPCYDATTEACTEKTGAFAVVATHPSNPPSPRPTSPPAPPPKLTGQPRVSAAVITRIHEAARRAKAGRSR